jgi:CRISPR/Cas system-associated protein Cas10 (large subunit of type III CRISPR-Cas system)
LSGRAAAALRALIERFRDDEYTAALRGRSEYMDLLLERLLDRMKLAADTLFKDAA